MIRLSSKTKLNSTPITNCPIPNHITIHSHVSIYLATTMGFTYFMYIHGRHLYSLLIYL